ncbi:hypothetical protein G6O67_002510 [Ophiocordyceps sinensis]|uniref:Uncharacterized protein n=1 Tax=Ophiocordyceps sinensis TaxID=72228 RepID=A0A8H4V7D0_9HYPO|nr:hypothetical protein G6O67_002510 [Ophiocordyceps sinensis]
MPGTPSSQIGEKEKSRPAPSEIIATPRRICFSYSAHGPPACPTSSHSNMDKAITSNPPMHSISSSDMAHHASMAMLGRPKDTSNRCHNKVIPLSRDYLCLLLLFAFCYDKNRIINATSQHPPTKLHVDSARAPIFLSISRGCVRNAKAQAP